MAALTFTEFYPAHVSEKSGKQVPPKVKTADGVEYACGKNVNLPLVVGQSYEVIVTTKTNGQYINHYLQSAIPTGTAPSTTYLPGNQPAPAATNGHAAAPTPAPAKKDDYWRPRDPKEELRIIRQSVLKAAVELTVAGHVKPERVFAQADEMVKWVYTGNPNGIPTRVPVSEGDVPPPPSDAEYPWN